MRPAEFAIAVAFGVLAAAPAADAAQIHVNGACGNDAWTGTSPLCAAPDGPKATIQAAVDVTNDGDEVVVADGVYTGAGNRDVDFGGREITVRSANGPDACTIDAEGAGRAFLLTSGETLDSVIEGFTVTNCAGGTGGAVEIVDSSATIRDCVFSANAAEVGGALHQEQSIGVSLALHLLDTTFSSNSADVAAGAVLSTADELIVAGCVFSDNSAGNGGGGMVSGADHSAFFNNRFLTNTAPALAGGVIHASNGATFANNVFSQNSSGTGGGLFGDGIIVITGCTFAGNGGSAITMEAGAVGDLDNSILWGNAANFGSDPGGGSGTVTVQYSDIEGGFPGPGNIDADPLFVQPGTDDLRLSEGSPAIDAGNTSLLPPDDLDLDGDGDVTEPLPVDLAGFSRVQGASVDMGAYEGDFAPGAPADQTTDLDQGEAAFLIPEGGDFDPTQNAAVVVMNTTGPDNAAFTVTQRSEPLHPGAGGFGELSVILQTQTTLEDGQYVATMFIPLSASDLDGAVPVALDLTWFDEASGNWALAVSGNAQPSAGFTGPIGDRVTVLDGGGFGFNTEVGDYGVFWDPQAEGGFVWANVDHGSDFGAGAALCPSDCRQSPDGQIGVPDLLELLARWGGAAGGGPCDVDYNGVIDTADFEAFLLEWGPCTAEPSAPAAPAPAVVVPALRADLDGDGSVGTLDLASVEASWGPCAGCPADLDGDGVVATSDYLAVLARWGTAAAP